MVSDEVWAAVALFSPERVAPQAEQDCRDAMLPDGAHVREPICCVLAGGSTLEAPACGAWLVAGGSYTERHAWRDDVEIPWRRPGARRAVGGGEGSVLHA